MPFGRAIGYPHPAPERTASRPASGAWDAETVFQVWTNRAALARTVRMQERGSPSRLHWRPLVALSPGEGF